MHAMSLHEIQRKVGYQSRLSTVLYPVALASRKSYLQQIPVLGLGDHALQRVLVFSGIVYGQSLAMWP